MTIDKAPYYFGANINLMSCSILKKLGGGEVKPTTMALQLADPYRVMEDVLVKVCKFIFPMDFVILDMEEGTKVSLILGRPFSAI